MKAGHLSREHGVGWRWGTSDWAIRSVSLRGQGKVMKSGGEPSSSLKHKFSKRLHGLLGRWAPSFLVRESENSACVRSAEDASVGFGQSPVTKVNIWAKSLLESDLVYVSDRQAACVYHTNTNTHKRVCVCVASHCHRWSHVIFCGYWTRPPSGNTTLSDQRQSPQIYPVFIRSQTQHTGIDSVLICADTALRNHQITAPRFCF